MSAPGTRGVDGFRRLSPLTPVVRAPIVVLAFIGASWQSILEEDRVDVTGVLLMLLLVGGGLYGVASWVRTKFWVADDELRIDTGVFYRQSRRIRIDRIQGIDIVQPLVARFFGLAELRFDLASGSEREGTLAFLPLAEARELRALLLRRRLELRDGDPTSAPWGRGPGSVPAYGPLHGPFLPGQMPSEAFPPRPGPDPSERADEVVLGRLDQVRLLLSLAASTETVVLGGGAVLLLLGSVAAGSMAPAGGVLPVLLALALGLGRRLTSSWGFVLTRSPHGLHVRRGLTSLSSQTIALHRVQGLVVTEPWLWRPFGWARLEVSVAGYQAGDGDAVQSPSTLMPVAPRAEVFALVREVLQGRDAATVMLSPAPRRARWRAPLTAWTLALGRSDDLVASRRGYFARRLDLVPLERVQSVRLVQGPLQQRLRLADLVVDSPPGPVRVAGLLREPAEARQFLESVVADSMAARRRLLEQAQPHRTSPATPQASTSTPDPFSSQ